MSEAILDAQGGGRKATCCRLPYDVKPREADLYRKILSCHCKHVDKDEPGHQCTGAATISENAIVLRCKQCGDAKGTFPHPTTSTQGD
jgi:flavoprotein